MGAADAVGLGAALLLLTIPACDKQPSRNDRPAAARVAPSTPASADSEARLFFVARERQRCVVYWRAGTEVSYERVVRCPREIDPGERMRLSGSACFRESEEPTRRIPIRCSKSIIDAREELRTQAATQLRVRQQKTRP